MPICTVTGVGFPAAPEMKTRPENAPCRASWASVSSVSYFARCSGVRTARICSRVASRIRVASMRRSLSPTPRAVRSRIFWLVSWRMDSTLLFCSTFRPSAFVSRSRTCSGDWGAPPPVTPGAPPRTGTLSSPGRRKRSAAFGTLSTPSFCATTRRTLAVIPVKSVTMSVTRILVPFSCRYLKLA